MTNFYQAQSYPVASGVASSVYSGEAQQDTGTVFSFASGTIPTEFTFTRNDTTPTYVDGNGKLQLGVANQPRPYYIGSTLYGIWLEIGRTNKCTCSKINPAATTNLTKTGDAAGVLSLVSDSTALATAGLDVVCSNGMVFDCDNTLGVTNMVVTVGGTTGNTNNHSFSAYGRMVTGAFATMQTTESAGTLSFNTSAYQRLQANNITVGSSSVQVRFIIPAASRLRFIIPQFEEGSNSTTAIVSSATASVARINEILVDTSFGTRSYFNLSEGAIVVDVMYPNILTNPASAPFFIGSGSDVNFDNCIGMATIAATTRRRSLSRYYSSSVQQYAADIGSIDAVNQHYAFATSWVNGTQATAASGAAVYQTFAASSISALDRLYLGGRSTTDYINGCLMSVKIYKRYRSPIVLGLDMVRSNDYTVPVVGQSNATGWFSAQSGSNNTGEISGKAVIDAVWTSNRSWLVNAGTAGTSLLYYSGTSTDATYWYNLSTGAYGEPLRRCIDIIRGCSNSTEKAIICVNGESDAGNCTIAEYKQGMNALLDILRSETGVSNLKMIIVPIGRNTSALNGYQTIKEATWELYSEQPTDFYRAPERFDLALSDSIHLTDTANGTCATRTTRKMLSVLGETVTGGVNGPRITNATRVTTTVTVTIAHDTGTDFTPTTNISNFSYFNGADYTAAANVITAAVRTNATTITLTLTSNSAGTLYYGLGSTSTAAQANMVIDNSAQLLPLQASKWTVT